MFPVEALDGLIANGYRALRILEVRPEDVKCPWMCVMTLVSLAGETPVIDQVVGSQKSELITIKIE